MKKFVITTKITDRSEKSFDTYLKEISKLKPLTREEEKVFFDRVTNGDETAINEIVSRNLKFVVSVAKKYASPQTPINDLINEGNYGLILAVKTFKQDMGFKFISYAIWWIRKTIMDYITNNGRLIRIPANKVNSLNKINKEISLLEQKYNRSVTPDEVLTIFLDESDTKINSEFKKSKKELQAVISTNFSDIESLNKDLDFGDDVSITLSDTISDDMFESIEDTLNNKDNNNKITKVLNTLKPRDKKIIIDLFGLDGGFPKTLSDISEEIGLSKEMVRQIRNKTLDKLKTKLCV